MDPTVSAVVLAGGRGRRLGSPKALLQLDGEWLLERILRQLGSLGDDVLVVADNVGQLERFGARVVQDVQSGKGPLGGIYSGLQAMRNQRGLFLACDMPLLNLDLLRYMVVLSAHFDAVIPRVGKHLEPLHAIYSKSCLEPIAASLALGELRIVHFLPQVRVRFVETEEIDAFDPQHRSWFNINTPADLDTAAKLLNSQ